MYAPNVTRPWGQLLRTSLRGRPLDHLAEPGQGTGEAGGAGAALQRARTRRGDDGTGSQRGGEPSFAGHPGSGISPSERMIGTGLDGFGLDDEIFGKPVRFRGGVGSCCTEYPMTIRSDMAYLSAEIGSA